MKQRKQKRKMEFLKRLNILLYLILIAIFLANCSRRQSIISTSVSPDGRYKCVITEQSPSWYMESPYIYRITIKNKDTGKELEGDAYERNNDSAVISGSRLTYEWKDNQLLIVEHIVNETRAFAIATIENGKQIWK